MKEDEKEQILNKWIKEHGACSFDLKEKVITLHDGGIFSINTKTEMLRNVIGTKKIEIGKYKGNYEVLFTKEKFPTLIHEGTLWFDEIDETISYFQSIKRVLNKVGYNTGIQKNEKRNKNNN